MPGSLYMFFSKIFCNSDDEMQLNEVLILSGDDKNWTKTTMKYAKSSHGASACDLMVSNNIWHLYVCIMLVENDLLTLSMGMGLWTQ